MANQQWEYAFHTVGLVEKHLEGSLSMMNTHGKLGWELVGMYPQPGTDDGSYVAILKKPKSPVNA